jgi:AcrR family transcriptional regulator/protoporphyrinogen oxidase
MRESTRRKREHVVRTALKLFNEKGYENVSVDEIIAATGTSKGTFYHYFRGKEEIVAELGKLQSAVIQQWNARTPARIKSLEGHVNRLFLDLSSKMQDYPELLRSLFALALKSPMIRTLHETQGRELMNALVKWLPERRKAEFLFNLYYGTLLDWSLRPEADLQDVMRRQLETAWHGLRSDSFTGLVIENHEKEASRMRVAVIGGGLAGLTAAAYLSERPGIDGILFERSPQLGGRAFTYEKEGFTLNYGAHAIYGIDRHTIGKLEKELQLSFSSNQVDKRKVMYEKGEQVTPAPLDFANLMKTELLNSREKVRFVAEIAAIIANIHKLRNYPTLGDYLAESDASEDVKELWEHLVCSNFFITPEDARQVPGVVISEYYHNLFLSGKPVNYILGSWAVITNQLRGKIESSGRWEIALKEAVETLRYENGKYVLSTKKREEAFDKVVFAMPAQHAAKLLKGTPWEPFLAPYENNTPTEVMVYDLGLSRVVARPFSYISDMNRKMFITDVSATDPTLTPDGGQLLQGIAYLHDAEFEDEEMRKRYLEERLAQMEGLFDRHYPGWRDAIAVKRMSKKAMVQSVKHIEGNRMLPVRVESCPFYFCGDGCEGKGELAERAFSSARQAAKLILEEHARFGQPVPV